MPNPKYEPEEDLQMGEQTLELAKKDKAKVQPRLEAGILEGLGEDLGHLREGSGNAAVLRAQKVAKTRTQNENVARVVTLVQATRNAAKAAGLGKAVLKAMGVGRKINPGLVKSVRAAAAMVVEAYGTHTAEMRRAGILPEDIDALIGTAGSLEAADSQKEQAKVASWQGTEARKAAQLRVEQAVGLILAAAELALSEDPARLALYRAVVPSAPKGRKAPKAA
jgi:hypothetical protein